MSTEAASRSEVARPLLRGICLVVTGNDSNQRRRLAATPDSVRQFPQRPDGRVLSETIPLFFIARNKNKFWVAREADGRTGGIFLFKRSALRFAAKHGLAVGCATMFLSDRFELDVENQGNRLVAVLVAGLRNAAQSAPKLGVFIAAALGAARRPIAGESR
jgi:hypothetical protein